MRILITGASGFLGRRLVKAACQAGHRVWAWTSPGEVVTDHPDENATYASVELTNPIQVADAFWQAKPMAVIHAGAMSSIAACYRDPVRAFRVNAESTRQLVALCVAGITRLIYLSTDLVFNGLQAPYAEHDTPLPGTLYAKSKLDGERAVLHHPGHLVTRLSWLAGLGTTTRPHFLDEQIASLRQRKTVSLFEDEWRTPLSANAAAHALVQLSERDVSGVLHLGGPERLSRYEMGCILAKVLGVNVDLIQGESQKAKKTPEQRPSDVSLNSALWRRLMPESPWPTFESAIRQELGIV